MSFAGKTVSEVFEARSELNETQLETVNYITTMANSFMVDIGSTSFEKFERDGAIIEDKQEINKIIFELGVVNKASPAACNLVTQIPDEYLERITEQQRSMLDGRESQIKDTIANEIAQINDFEGRINIHIANLRQAYDDQLMLKKFKEGTDTIGGPVVEEIKKIAASNEWQFLKAYGSVVYFANRQCVRQSFVNPAAGVDIHINYGVFVARLDLSGDSLRHDSIRVYKFLRNLEAGTNSRYIHPHVSGSGKICWGNVKAAVSDLMAQGRYATVFNHLHDLLNTYCPDNPYVGIEAFEANILKGKITRIDNEDEDSDSVYVRPSDLPDNEFVPPQWDVETVLDIGDIVKIKSVAELNSPTRLVDRYAFIAHKMRSDDIPRQYHEADGETYKYTIRFTLHVSDDGTIVKNSITNCFSRDELDFVTTPDLDTVYTEEHRKFVDTLALRRKEYHEAGIPYLGDKVFVSEQGNALYGSEYTVTSIPILGGTQGTSLLQLANTKKISTLSKYLKNIVAGDALHLDMLKQRMIDRWGCAAIDWGSVGSMPECPECASSSEVQEYEDDDDYTHWCEDCDYLFHEDY